MFRFDGISEKKKRKKHPKIDGSFRAHIKIFYIMIS